MKYIIISGFGIVHSYSEDGGFSSGKPNKYFIPLKDKIKIQMSRIANNNYIYTDLKYRLIPLENNDFDNIKFA